MNRSVSRSTLMTLSEVNLLRMVIASYFIAVSLQLFPPTDGIALALTTLPSTDAQLAVTSLICVAAFFVLMGAWLQIAAATLAVVALWSIYVAVLGAGQTGQADVLSSVWRDVALTIALVISCAPGLRRLRPASARRIARARHITPRTEVAPRRVTATAADSDRPAAAPPKALFIRSSSTHSPVPDNVIRYPSGKNAAA